MLIDFESIHRTFLIGQPVNGEWQFTPTNEKNPRTGIFPSSHQVFSNHGLQIAVYLYNSVRDGTCTGVSHCLYLLFTKKQGGKYLLATDKQRLAFNLDIGVAGDLFALSQGYTDSFTYSAIRSGKPPKRLFGSVEIKNGRRHVILRAESSVDGVAVNVEVDLDRASTIALAAHCVAYGRLLYPSISDSSVRALLSENRPIFRACAEISSDRPGQHAAELLPVPSNAGDGLPRACADNPRNRQPGQRAGSGRLASVVWAIGNQKWPSMKLEALQKIQAITDATLLQRMIDEANNGDFKAWDSYLL